MNTATQSDSILSLTALEAFAKLRPGQSTSTLTVTEALCFALGWQGGTLAQVAEATGCTGADLLSPRPAQIGLTSEQSMGFSAGRTCSIDFNRRVNFPGYAGNVDFWQGVARGIQLG